MAEAILMPKAGISVESCIITEWFKQPGDRVEKSEILFSYETDKSSFECESTASGFLLEVFFGEGEEVPVLTSVCAIGAPGDDVSGLRPAGMTSKSEDAANYSAVAEYGDVKDSDDDGFGDARYRGDDAQIGDARHRDDDGFDDVELFNNIDKISPRARNLAKKMGVNTTLIKPTGPGGRVIERDIRVVTERGGAVMTPATAAAADFSRSPTYIEGTGIGGRVSVSDISRVANNRAVEDAPAYEGAGHRSSGAAARAADDAPAYEGAGHRYPGATAQAADGAPAYRGAGHKYPGAATRAADGSPAYEGAGHRCPGSAARAADGAPAYEDVKFSGIRRVISKNMTLSLSTIPQLTHNFSFDATEIIAYRADLKKNSDASGRQNISLNDVILFAVSRILPKYPALNAHMLIGDSIRYFKDIHLGFAVDTDRGLMVPIIRHASRKDLTQIALEAKTLAQQAKDNTLSPDDMSGGTFTVSNLGVFGVESFTPVINPPQTAILGVNNITERPRMENGQITLYPAMGISLTYDHRAIDGAPASRFANELCKALENFKMLLGDTSYGNI